MHESVLGLEMKRDSCIKSQHQPCNAFKDECYQDQALDVYCQKKRSKRLVLTLDSGDHSLILALTSSFFKGAKIVLLTNSRYTLNLMLEKNTAAVRLTVLR